MEVTEPRDTAWVGVDIGRTHHWVCAIDADGSTLLSVKVRLTAHAAAIVAEPAKSTEPTGFTERRSSQTRTTDETRNNHRTRANRLFMNDQG